MIYVASPYSHEDASVVLARVKAVEEFCVDKLTRGHHVYSPIVYSHELALKYRLKTTAEYWKEFNAAFLRHATEVWVLCLPGWTNSIGVTMEINWANSLNIPVKYFSVD